MNNLNIKELGKIGEFLIYNHSKATSSHNYTVDIEKFISEDLMVKIGYAEFSNKNSGKLAFVSDGKTPVEIIKNDKLYRRTYPKETIAMSSVLLKKEQEVLKNLTLARQASKIILNRLSKSDDLLSTEEINEQIETMAISLILPKFLLEKTLARFTGGKRISIYGGNTMKQEDRKLLMIMAEYLGVSYFMLVSRLKSLCYFERKEFAEYFKISLRSNDKIAISAR